MRAREGARAGSKTCHPNGNTRDLSDLSRAPAGRGWSAARAACQGHEEEEYARGARGEGRARRRERARGARGARAS